MVEEKVKNSLFMPQKYRSTRNDARRLRKMPVAAVIADQWFEEVKTEVNSFLHNFGNISELTGFCRINMSSCLKSARVQGQSFSSLAPVVP